MPCSMRKHVSFRISVHMGTVGQVGATQSMTKCIDKARVTICGLLVPMSLLPPSPLLKFPSRMPSLCAHFGLNSDALWKSAKSNSSPNGAGRGQSKRGGILEGVEIDHRSFRSLRPILRTGRLVKTSSHVLHYHLSGFGSVFVPVLNSSMF